MKSAGQQSEPDPKPYERVRPVGAKGEPARGGGNGNHGRWVGEKFIPAEEIINQTRALLSNSFPAGDIKRTLVRLYGGSGRSFERYLSVARKRNLQAIGRSPAEAKSDSVWQWSRLLSEQFPKRGRCEQELEAARKKLDQLQKAYDEAKGDDVEQAGERLDRQVGMVRLAEGRLAAVNSAIERHQHTLDNILGNRAPIQLEDVTDKKAEIANPTEPLTEKESDAKIKEFVSKLRAGTVAPSEN